MTDELSTATRPRTLDPGALRALAHPLRVELYETLSAFGSSTCSALGERLGESSGATSYHLRQLARHGLVREVEGKGSARERWWEVNPNGISVSTLDYEHEAGQAAAKMVVRQWERNRAAVLEEFQAGADALPREWQEATTLATINVSATFAEFGVLNAAFQDFIAEHIDPLRGREVTPETRRVQVHLNAFPIIDPQRRPLEGE